VRSHTNLGLIGSAVLTLIGYKQTDRHPNKVLSDVHVSRN